MVGILNYCLFYLLCYSVISTSYLRKVNRQMRSKEVDFQYCLSWTKTLILSITWLWRRLTSFLSEREAHYQLGLQIHSSTEVSSQGDTWVVQSGVSSTSYRSHWCQECRESGSPVSCNLKVSITFICCSSPGSISFLCIRHNIPRFSLRLSSPESSEKSCTGMMCGRHTRKISNMLGA